ncbi:MAG TPA: bifunctional 5,10-methylenetetrahydrofolate dehydrogenase/5,10-methenyltetrahydrofolate cyclohydrolase [Candidatus Paceibacterota bacterium]
MMINGKQLAEERIQALKEQVSTMPQKKIGFIVFERTYATEQFVNIKMKIAEKIGIDAEIVEYDDELTTEAAEDFVYAISAQYDGIVVQLPLPPQLDTQVILNTIPLIRDCDVLSDIALEAYAQGRIEAMPPVASAVHHILASINVDLAHKNIVIVGNGRLVGSVVSRYFKRQNIAHTIITETTPQHEYTSALKHADIIISGVGKPHLITPDMVKQGVILIDAGTSEQAGKVAGDIDPACYEKASYYTPVPGGVGPLAVVGVFENLMKS